ncbi:MAG: hypothetical protein GIW99_01825 [Candidatus Eremiobacteraeota bacterium]|nr:hypothetical protein [Candidatus Eremiobacteraeota bacterium]MBC5826414.1 hypothetical protein [Candidatus Eremiobacteraeota bacterium]
MRKQAPRFQSMDKDHLNAVSGYWLQRMLGDDIPPYDIGSAGGAQLVFKGMKSEELDASPDFWFYLGFEFALDVVGAICAHPLGDPTPAILKARYRTRRDIRDSQMNVIKRRPLTTLENEHLCELEDAFNNESLDG